MRKNIAWAVVCMMVLIGLYACGGSGGGNDNTPAPSNLNLAGTWNYSGNFVTGVVFRINPA